MFFFRFAVFVAEPTVSYAVLILGEGAVLGYSSLFSGSLTNTSVSRNEGTIVAIAVMNGA